MTDDQNTANDSDVTAVAAAVTDGAYTLFVADFGRHVAIDGVIVVKREADGKLDVQKATDHSTKRGLTWGLVGGAVLGVIFPPSIIGSAAALGVAGAGIGKARELHHKSELSDELEAAIAPGHSGIVALVSDPGAVEIRKALSAANAIVESTVDSVAAKDIKAAAKESEAEASSD
jgi:uncharacterized membrane protein